MPHTVCRNPKYCKRSLATRKMFESLFSVEHGSCASKQASSTTGWDESDLAIHREQVSESYSMRQIGELFRLIDADDNGALGYAEIQVRTCSGAKGVDITKLAAGTS